eukprot:4479893-Prorocentrum_lima.AAC.1
MFHTRTQELQGIHAQVNHAIMYLCARQHPLLEWNPSAVIMVHKWFRSKGSDALLQHLGMPRKHVDHSDQPVGPEK